MIMITLKSFYIHDCPGSLLVLRAYHQVTESPAGPPLPPLGIPPVYPQMILLSFDDE